MAQFLIVIVLNLAKVTCPILTALIPIFFLFLARFYFTNIEFSSRKGVCLLSLLLIIVAALLLLIFESFFEGFKLVFGNSGFLRPDV